MGTFAAVLHVLAAVFVIGPLAMAPFGGLRGIRHRDARQIHDAVRWTTWFGLGSLLVFLLGAWAVSTSDDVGFGTSWITISMTLYIVGIAVIFGLAIPSLRRTERMIREGVLDDRGAPGAAAADAEEMPPTVTTSTDELHSKAKLDAMAGRSGAAATVALLVWIAITVLMVVKPFE